VPQPTAAPLPVPPQPTAAPPPVTPPVAIPPVAPPAAPPLVAVDSKPCAPSARLKVAPPAAHGGHRPGWFASLEIHASLLTDAADRSLLSGTFGYSFKGGRRWQRWGTFLLLEHNLWLSMEQGAEVVQGAINIGLGVELIYAGGFVRSAAALGPSILAFNTTLDSAGTAGLFLLLEPVGLRWPVHRHVVLGLNPLCFALVAPVLGSIPLINVEYRTSFYAEGRF
jgi:hypothetical protein